MYYVVREHAHNKYSITHSMYCTLSGTGPLRMESSTRHPSGTTWDDVPGPSGEWL